MAGIGVVVCIVKLWMDDVISVVVWPDNVGLDIWVRLSVEGRTD